VRKPKGAKRGALKMKVRATLASQTSTRYVKHFATYMSTLRHSSFTSPRLLNFTKHSLPSRDALRPVHTFMNNFTTAGENTLSRRMFAHARRCVRAVNEAEALMGKREKGNINLLSRMAIHTRRRLLFFWLCVQG
jgi:hypothetical protein